MLLMAASKSLAITSNGIALRDSRPRSQGFSLCCGCREKPWELGCEILAFGRTLTDQHCKIKETLHKNRYVSYDVKTDL